MQHNVDRVITGTDVSSSAPTVVFPAQTTSVGVAVSGSAASSRSRSRASIAVENAVFAYIQAKRALGKTTINTVEIAENLDLSVSKVDAAVAGLRDRGVRPL